MINLVISFVRTVRDTLLVVLGGVVYLIRSRTPSWSYQAMIRLFCRSGGRSNDVLSTVVRVFDRRVEVPEPRGELGVHSMADAGKIAARIEEDGYYILDQRLPAETCDRLLDFALKTRARVRPMHGELREGGAALRREIYDRSRPVAARYDYEIDDVANNPDVQALLASPSVLAIASSYLRSTPKADFVTMWWHTAYSKQPDEEAAQFYHFDMDRIKWLKFFIYLTDVDAGKGPHCFVRKSHRTGGISSRLLSKGYARLTDEEVFEHYSRDDIIEFSAPRGTVIAEDTRGLHKGRELLDGDRLMLQLQFSISLFGGQYPPGCFRSLIPELQAVARLHPKIYRNYVRATHVQS